MFISDLWQGHMCTCSGVLIGANSCWPFALWSVASFLLSHTPALCHQCLLYFLKTQPSWPSRPSHDLGELCRRARTLDRGDHNLACGSPHHDVAHGQACGLGCERLRLRQHLPRSPLRSPRTNTQLAYVYEAATPAEMGHVSPTAVPAAGESVPGKAPVRLRLTNFRPDSTADGQT